MLRNDDTRNFLFGFIFGMIIQSMFKLIPDNVSNANGDSDY